MRDNSIFKIKIFTMCCLETRGFVQHLNPETDRGSRSKEPEPLVEYELERMTLDNRTQAPGVEYLILADGLLLRIQK
jgi:hypothetical protein